MAKKMAKTRKKGKKSRSNRNMKRRLDGPAMLIKEQTLLSKERTVLSKERTILSYIQTGVAFIGIGIVIINVFSSNMESVIVGTALILLGFIEIIDSYRRLSRYRRKMDSIKRKLGKESI